MYLEWMLCVRTLSINHISDDLLSPPATSGRCSQTEKAGTGLVSPCLLTQLRASNPPLFPQTLHRNNNNTIILNIRCLLW